MKEYVELILEIVELPIDDIVRTSGLNSNGQDHDGAWDGNWDRG